MRIGMILRLRQCGGDLRLAINELQMVVSGCGKKRSDADLLESIRNMRVET